MTSEELWRIEARNSKSKMSRTTNVCFDYERDIDTLLAEVKRLKKEAIEDSLVGTLRVVSGQILPPLGPGIHTWPEGNERNKGIHAGCLELEKRGLIYRQVDEPGHVFWMPGKCHG